MATRDEIDMDDVELVNLLEGDKTVKYDAEKPAPKRFYNFLICWDGTAHSEEALALAFKMISDTKLKKAPNITVVRAYNGVTEAAKNEHRAEAELALKMKKDEIRARWGIEVRVVAVCGDSRQTLCEFANDGDFHLVFVGSRGKGLLARAIKGSVSTYMSHHCARPLCVVNYYGKKAPDESPGFLCPMDASDCSGRAFTAALALFPANSPPEKSVKVLCVADQLYGVDMEGVYDESKFLVRVAAANARLEKRITAYLARYAKQITGGDVKITAKLERGEARDFIDKHSHRNDIVFVGSRGRSALARALLGSVSDYVLHYTQCRAVVIVK